MVRTEFFEIDPSLVIIDDLDDDWEHAHSYPRSVVEEWVAALPEIQRRRDQQGWDASRFHAALNSADAKERLIGDCYRFFYESTDECIAVALVDGRYTVTNGRHRLMLARVMGVMKVPARVTIVTSTPAAPPQSVPAGFTALSTQIDVDPNALRMFAHAARAFSTDVRQQMLVLRRELGSLSHTWRDVEQEWFATELERTLQFLDRCIEAVEAFELGLVSRAEALDAYHDQR